MLIFQQRVQSKATGNEGAVEGVGFLVRFDNGELAMLDSNAIEAAPPAPAAPAAFKVGDYVRLPAGAIGKVVEVTDSIWVHLLAPSEWTSLVYEPRELSAWSPADGDRVECTVNKKVGTVQKTSDGVTCTIKWDFNLAAERWDSTMVKPYEQPSFEKDDVVICINPLWSTGLTATVLTQDGGKLWVIWNKRHWKYAGQADGLYSTDSFRHYDASVMSNAA